MADVDAARRDGRSAPIRMLRDAGRSSLVAVAFLTRLPGVHVGWRPGDLRRALGAFPAVGAGVAAIGIAVRLATAPLLGPTAGVVLAVLATIVVTGALHHDGLADTADGLWGAFDPARRLQIMHDSAVGVYGVLAVVGAVALELALLLPLDSGEFARALLVGHVVGRGAAVALVASVSPARTDGLGAQLRNGPGRLGATIATLSVLAVPVVALGRHAWAPLVAGGLTLLAVRTLAQRRLGGYTGDVLGALVVTGQLTAIAAVAIVAG